ASGGAAIVPALVSLGQSCCGSAAKYLRQGSSTEEGLLAQRRKSSSTRPWLTPKSPLILNDFPGRRAACSGAFSRAIVAARAYSVLGFRARLGGAPEGVPIMWSALVRNAYSRA